MKSNKHGGKRQGAGRKSRPTRKSRPIWCGQVSEEDRTFIINRLSPEERFSALMTAANSGSTRPGKAPGG